MTCATIDVLAGILLLGFLFGLCVGLLIKTK